jgi:hypothetical protein
VRLPTYSSFTSTRPANMWWQVRCEFVQPDIPECPLGVVHQYKGLLNRWELLRAPSRDAPPLMCFPAGRLYGGNWHAACATLALSTLLSPSARCG